MFPKRNGTRVLFIPAYVDHGSTSSQSNGVMVGWRRFGVGTISTSGHYVVNLPMSTKKQQMIGKGT
jgi:hypothetical protein